MATYTLSVEEMGQAHLSLSVSQLPAAATIADDFLAAFNAQATDIILDDTQHDITVLGLHSGPAVPAGGKVIASKLSEQRFG